MGEKPVRTRTSNPLVNQVKLVSALSLSDIQTILAENEVGAQSNKVFATVQKLYRSLPPGINKTELITAVLLVLTNEMVGVFNAL